MVKATDDANHSLFARAPQLASSNSDEAKAGAESADDLRALLRKAALSESQYREFGSAPSVDEKRAGNSPSALESQNASAARVPPTLLKEQREPPVGANNAANESKPAKAGFDVGGDSNGAPPQTPAGHFHKSPKSSGPAAGARWSVLERALEDAGNESAGSLVRAFASSVSIPFLFVGSVSGGAGATTILATLARLFAGDGEQVVLAGLASLSLFPLYFGANNPGAGEFFTFPEGDCGGCVATTNRCEEEKAARAASGFAGKSEKLRFLPTIRSVAAKSNRLLLDCGQLNTADLEDLCTVKQFGLVPVVPDLSSVFGLLKMERFLEAREGQSDPPVLFYVLNKFDASQALHRDVQASLRSHLGDRLLPITLRRSDAAAEALADGKTVIDYSPGSGLAQDYLQLAEWLRRSSARNE